MTYKDETRSAQSGKARRMLGDETDTAHKIADAESTQTSLADRAKRLAGAGGGKATGKLAPKRLDKPARARGGAVKGKGKTTVNVIVSPPGGPNGGAPQAMVLPPSPSPVTPPMPAGGLPPQSPVGAPPMPPRPPMGGAGPGPVPPMPMRQRGGRVKMSAGAGSGVGRLQKAAL